MNIETQFNDELIDLKAAKIRRSFAALKLTDPRGEHRLEQSLSRYGQLNPVIVAAVSVQELELVDGFKRVRCLERLNGGEALIQSRVMLGGLSQWKSGMLLMNWGQRSVTVMEEAMILLSMQEDGLKLHEIGVLLRRHKSWVCRRIALVKRLDERVKEHLRLGLISASAGRELVLLPRGNQGLMLDAVEEHQLSMREIEAVVKQLLGKRSVSKDAVMTAIDEIRDRKSAAPKLRKHKSMDAEAALTEALGNMRDACRAVVQAVAGKMEGPHIGLFEGLTDLAREAVEAAESGVAAVGKYYLEDYYETSD